MAIDNRYKRALEELFPGVVVGQDIDGCLLIRTDNWLITSDELRALSIMGLNICAIMIDGDGIALTIDRKSTQKVIAR